MQIDRVRTILNRRRQKQPPPLPEFLFVVTYGRSGSTLIQGLLNAMPGTLVRGENNFFVLPLFRAWADLKAFRNSYARTGSRGPHSAFFGLDEMSLRRHVLATRRLAMRQLLGNRDRAGVDVLGFKEVLWHRIEPEETEEFFTFFERVFPGARYVLNRRDHDSVATSGFWRQRDREEVAIAIRRVEEIQDYLRGTRRGRALDVRYEELTSSDPETVREQLIRLAEFAVGTCDDVLLGRLQETMAVGHGPRPFGRSRVDDPHPPPGGVERVRPVETPQRVSDAHRTAREVGEPRVVVITMARDEAVMLPRWMSYYASQVGVENLIVIDDNSSDGSTEDLPCQVLRLPPGPWKGSFGTTRMRVVSGVADALLGCYDVAIFCDTDEFLVPDPACHDGLLDFLAKRADRAVIAPVALNVLHKADLEPPLDPSRRILEQRRFVKFAPVMCKPSIKRVSAAWTAASHGISVPFEVDPELFLIHLKFHDEQALLAVGDHRRRMHKMDGRSAGTTWEIGGSGLVDQLREWVKVSPAEEVRDVDVRDLDLSEIVKRTRRWCYRATGGGQLGAMASQPLLRLPDRFCSLL